MRPLFVAAGVFLASPADAFDIEAAVHRLSEVGPPCMQHGNPAFESWTDKDIEKACTETEALIADIEANGYCQGDREHGFKWVRCAILNEEPDPSAARSP